jgi:hypothetical protein
LAVVPDVRRGEFREVGRVRVHGAIVQKDVTVRANAEDVLADVGPVVGPGARGVLVEHEGEVAATAPEVTVELYLAARLGVPKDPVPLASERNVVKPTA